VRYKLDRQVDHVLIDEAQDTNPAQWEIIEQLVDEFFSGSAETERRTRTLFMVGDQKQAIYGFQGSDPERFQQKRDHFRRRAEDLSDAERATEFRDLSIAASFRSAQPILDVVDAMVATVGPGALALREPPPRHLAHHGDRAGLVELWPPFAVEEALDDSDEGDERWVSLRDRYYADALAERIRAMIDEAPILASTRRPLTPGDILVLVRSRGELASLIVARLFSAGVPVAGVDRLHLHEPLAVQDLLAAIKFAVQPDDSLNLACLLASPIIGWEQERLYELAHGRKGSPPSFPKRTSSSHHCWRWPITPRRRGSSRRSSAGRSPAGASCTGGSGQPRPTRSTNWSTAPSSSSGPRSPRSTGSSTGSRAARSMSSAIPARPGTRCG
jgi:ATP-dependent helicase/nuclease subunit A